MKPLIDKSNAKAKFSVSFPKTKVNIRAASLGPGPSDRHSHDTREKGK